MNNAFDAAGLRVFERGWLSSNNVLFDGGREHESVLVDSGYCTHSAQTVALVRAALGARSLHRIVNTHLHSDHCGGNDALQREFGCAIDVPSGEVEKVDRWDESALTYRDTGQNCPRFVRSGAVQDGDEIRCGSMWWKVIAAPGHDPESVVLHQPELRLLISADALWQNGFGVVFPEIEGVDAFDIVRQTLERLSELPVDWVIPGHGAPFQGIAAALTRAHSRLDGFLADPSRHARHAAKVLIKFRLLEIQTVARTELLAWTEATRYMRLTHARHFDALPFQSWVAGLLEELAASGAIHASGDAIRNI
jgi:glyoxylase-like metal-dependent hydrolase (beta-lactamase superfamily II)